MAAIVKKKLGERVGSSLFQLKGDDETPQIFSIVSPDVLCYSYHYDDIYKSLGKFMCMSEFDENGKVVSKAPCCKMFKKRSDKVLLLVIHYEGSKKKYRQYADGKIKYLSISSYRYNDLCKQLDDAGYDFEDAANGACDIVLKGEDVAHGKISFNVIDSDEKALWSETPELKKMVKAARDSWEEDIMASLPTEYTEEEFLKAIEEAKEASESPEGVEDPDEDDIPKKKKSKDSTPKSKKKVEKDLDDDDLDEDDEEDETPKKKKKKSVKEQIDEEDFDNEELEEDEEESDDDDLDEEDEEDETPKKKKKKSVDDEDDDLDEDDEEDDE